MLSRGLNGIVMMVINGIFDIDGNSMEVNQTVLKQALNMPVQTSIKRNRNGMPNQRLGIEEASVFMISHSNSD